MLIPLFRFGFLFLITCSTVYPVSIRRRKNLFGERTGNQEHNVAGPVVEQQAEEISVPESSVVTSTVHSSATVQGISSEQTKRQRGRPRLLAKKQYKSTEHARAWLMRKKEAAKKGDKKAIEILEKRYRSKLKSEKEKTARVLKGTATPIEQEQYKRLRAQQKRWKNEHRNERKAYLRKWRAKQKSNGVGKD